MFLQNVLIGLRRLTFKKVVFKNREGNWIDILPIITKQNNNQVQSPTKLTPIQASFKKNEGFVYQNLLHKRKKREAKCQVNDLFPIANLKRTSSKGDTTYWPYILYKTTEVINDTTPSYRIAN